QLACNWKRHADDSRLGCAVGRLTHLTVERSDRRGVEDDSALAAGVGRVLRHPLRGESGHVERADEIDVHHPSEARERMNALLAEDALAVHHTRAVDEPIDLA